MNESSSKHNAYKLSNNFSRQLIELAKDFERRALQKCHQRGHTKIRRSHCSLFSNLGFGAVRLTELGEQLVNDSMEIVDEITAEYIQSIGSDEFDSLELLLNNTVKKLGLRFLTESWDDTPSIS